MVLWSVKLAGYWWLVARSRWGAGVEWFWLLPADATRTLVASAVELVSRLRMLAPTG